MNPTGDYSELNAFFLLTDRPSKYNLPEIPARPLNLMKQRYLVSIATTVALAAAAAYFIRYTRE
jgi:hypothetical protein